MSVPSPALCTAYGRALRYPGILAIAEGDVYEPHRLLCCTALGPGYPGDAHAQVASAALYNALGHGPGGLLTDRAVLLQNLAGHT